MPVALIIAEYPTLYGGERSLLSVLPFLQQRQWSFHALVPAHGPLATALQQLSVNVLPWDNRDQFGRRLSLERLRTDIAQAVKQCRPQLVHANSLSVSRVVGPLTVAFPQIAFLGYLRDIIRLKRQNIDDLNQLDRLVAVSDATRMFHIRQGIEPLRIETIYNGVDLQLFGPGSRQGAAGEIRRSCGIPADSPLVLHTGQIGLRKGLDNWLSAARLVARHNRAAHFLIVGARHSDKAESREYEQKLRTVSAKGSLAGRVHWLGERQDVPELMQQATVLLHLAREEPLGRVLLEGFASGLPAVASHVGGTAEIFCNPTLQRWLVSPDDVEGAARRVIELLEHESLRASISATMRKVAEERFGAGRAAQLLAALYARLAVEKTVVSRSAD